MSEDLDEYGGAVRLVWEDGLLPPDREAAEAKIEAEIRRDLAGMEKPEDLVFHIVFLSDDDCGPSVMVYGKEGSDAFYCSYTPVTEWSR